MKCLEHIPAEMDYLTPRFYQQFLNLCEFIGYIHLLAPTEHGPPRQRLESCLHEYAYSVLFCVRAHRFYAVIFASFVFGFISPTVVSSIDVELASRRTGVLECAAFNSRTSGWRSSKLLNAIGETGPEIQDRKTHRDINYVVSFVVI